MFKPKSAYSDVFINARAGIPWICAGIEAVTPSHIGGFRWRNALGISILIHYIPLLPKLPF
jgi:hypothetical protein